MAQHFLLSSKAKTLSLAAVLRLSDDEAFEMFKALRWDGGEPVCPRCDCAACYTYKTRRLFKCKSCGAQFSATAGTIFADRKMKLRDILGAIAIFVNGAKGISALQMSRDLHCHYRTAYVLLHKLREVMGADQAGAVAQGEVEIDGSFYGGHVRPENRVEDRKDRRFKVNQSGKREAVIVMRERGGRTLPFVAKSEAAAVPMIMARVAKGAVIFADEGTAWDTLNGKYQMKRINHSVAFYDEGVETNGAESFFSRLRRAEMGVHHRISGKYLEAYAQEMGWREDRRRTANGAQFRELVAASLAHPMSSKWRGYTQRHEA